MKEVLLRRYVIVEEGEGAAGLCFIEKLLKCHRLLLSPWKHPPLPVVSGSFAQWLKQDDNSSQCRFQTQMRQFSRLYEVGWGISFTSSFTA
jgi:hypothetical protein